MGKLLLVDDSPELALLLGELLKRDGHEVVTATSGPSALGLIKQHDPDLILLDVQMPGMDGYEVCRVVRGDTSTYIPIIMVTGMPATERLKGLEAGADDFLVKPVDPVELRTRVRSLLRIKELHDTARVQAAKLASLNKLLQTRVNRQLLRLSRMNRLKRFVSPELANLVMAGAAQHPLRTHRRTITVVFVDLRNFTGFADRAAPKRVMSILRQYHKMLASVLLHHGGTLERFTGDGLMIVFNDPVPMQSPSDSAVRMAVEMRQGFQALQAQWGEVADELGFGVGIAEGAATIGMISLGRRVEYAAIGPVCNLAARLCGHARHGQVLVTDELYKSVERIATADILGQFSIKGRPDPITLLNVRDLRHTDPSPC